MLEQCASFALFKLNNAKFQEDEFEPELSESERERGPIAQRPLDGHGREILVSAAVS